MTTATALYAANPLTPVGTEKIAADDAAGVSGGLLSQAIANLFKGTKGADIASAATTSIGAATGIFVHVTGTTTITSFGSGTAGHLRLVRFAGILTLTHNATSLILPTGANITTAANDAAIFVSEGGSNWRCLAYMRANGEPLKQSGQAVTAVTPAAGVATFDLSLGDYFTIAPTADVTSIVFTNLPGAGKGARKFIRLTQDATPRAYTWPASFKWPGGVAGAVSTGAGAVDLLELTTFDNGTTWRAVLINNFA